MGKHFYIWRVPSIMQLCVVVNSAFDFSAKLPILIVALF
jgi:hypothetical protein